MAAPTGAPEPTPLSVVVSGNIGVGKSTLGGELAEHTGKRLVKEPSIENPYLAEHYEGKAGSALACQLWFLATRVQAHAAVKNKGVVLDRCLDEDRLVFARMQLDSGALSPADGDLYEKLFGMLTELDKVPKPSVILLLRASVDTLLERIKERGRDCEKNISREYLEAIDKYYQRFAVEMALTTCVIVVPWNDFSHSAAELWDRVVRIDTTRPLLAMLVW